MTAVAKNTEKEREALPYETGLFEMGITPLEVADRLGHERVETTMNIYAHIYPNKQRALSDKLEKVYREDLQ